jgi:dimethylargininase
MQARPKRALTREPGARYAQCISCHPLKATIDLGRAREQHRAYCAVLEDLGLEVIRMPRDDINPDSCFVEDAAVVHGRRALMCMPAVESRRGEVEAVAESLEDYLELARARPPATVEGGDVIHMEDRLISGITQRTNRIGVRQMSDCLDVRVDTVEDPRIVHLKSHVTYIGKDTAVASDRFALHDAFAGLRVIKIPEDEAYAADALAVGDVVLMAAGRHASHMLVREAGFEVIPVDVSEFEKCEGAITCLSILF